MSKAFVKDNDESLGDESDLELDADLESAEGEEDSDSDSVSEDGRPKFGHGSKNYITPEGLKKLVDERDHLLQVERPKLVETVAWAASNGDRSENADYQYGKRRLREIDRRLRFLRGRIDRAEVVDLKIQDSDRVVFGAIVTYEDPEGIEKTVQILGIDEADPARGQISWISPLGRALLQAKVGDVVQVKTPKGIDDLEVIAITYESRKNK